MKKIKALVSALLVGTMVFALAGCGAKITEYTAKDFKKALKDEADIDKDDIQDYDSDDYSTVYVNDEDYSIYFSEFDDEEDAYKAFRSMYHDYEDMKEDDTFEGTLKGSMSKSKGYILYNGTYDDGDDDYDIYGGVYFTGNMLVRIQGDSLKEKKTEKIDEILDALGFAKP